MKTVFDPISAFVVVDMQNDFLTEGGSMPLMKYKGSEDAEKLVGRVNFILSNYAEDFKCIAFTQDWHPPNHCSFLKNLPKAKVAKTSKISSNKAGPFDTVLFEGNPPYEQRMWPTHCIQHTPGADLHKDLLIGKKCALIRKGYLSCVDCESAFWNRNRMGQTDLPRLLASHKVTDVYICGVPYDLTVYQSVMDSLGFGYKTILLHDICRGVEEEAIVDSDYRIIRKNGLIANTEDLSDLMYCLDRPFVMGLQGLTKLLMDRVVTLKVK